MNELLSTLGTFFGAGPGALTNPDDPLKGALLGAGNTVAALAGTPAGASGLEGLLAGTGEALGFGASAAEGAGALGSVLGDAATAVGEGVGGAGTSAAALAPDIGGMGLATGLDSTAGAIGSEFGAGSLGEALAPVTSTLPQAPGAAQAVTSAAGNLSPISITPQIDLAGTALEGATGGPTTALGTAFSDPSFANILNAVGANKDLIGAGAAAIPLLTGFSSMPGQEQLDSLAQQMAGSSAALTGYLNSGTLPPGVQSGLKSASESAKAAMRSMFASRGMSGSSSEVAALANIDQTTAAQGAEIAMKLLDRGIQQQQMSSALYQVILRNAMEEDKAFGEAIGRFGAAMAA